MDSYEKYITIANYSKLLDCTGSKAWAQHVAGATALMKLRGSQLYKTDFERALLLAQAGPIVRILRNNK